MIKTNAKRNNRQHKKLRSGEWEEFGFDFEIVLSDDYEIINKNLVDDDFLIDKLLTLIEDNGCRACIFYGGSDIVTGFVYNHCKNGEEALQSIVNDMKLYPSFFENEFEGTNPIKKLRIYDIKAIDI